MLETELMYGIQSLFECGVKMAIAFFRMRFSSSNWALRSWSSLTCFAVRTSPSSRLKIAQFLGTLNGENVKRESYVRTPEYEAALEAWKETEQKWEAFLEILPARG